MPFMRPFVTYRRVELARVLSNVAYEESRDDHHYANGDDGA